MRGKMLLLIPILLCAASVAHGADEKIDPAAYICAELVASNLDGQPPIYEGLQVDGYSAASDGRVAADSITLFPMLLAVSDSCAAEPTEKVLDHWKEARKTLPARDDGTWRADKTTCADYYANPDDGSGFVIWLDGYYRGKTGKTTSVFTDQATLDHFLEVCKANPARLMLDVLAENAK